MVHEHQRMQNKRVEDKGQKYNDNEIFLSYKYHNPVV